MKYRLEVSIPGLPLTVNKIYGKNFWCRKKNADLWKNNVAVYSLGQRPELPLNKAQLILTRYSAKCPDFDGLVSSFKPCIDGLISSGIIIDDNMKVIGQPTYVWEKAPMKGGYIKIVVEEIELTQGG